MPGEKRERREKAPVAQRKDLEGDPGALPGPLSLPEPIVRGAPCQAHAINHPLLRGGETGRGPAPQDRGVAVLMPSCASDRTPTAGLAITARPGPEGPCTEATAASLLHPPQLPQPIQAPPNPNPSPAPPTGVSTHPAPPKPMMLYNIYHLLLPLFIFLCTAVVPLIHTIMVDLHNLDINFI